MRKPLSYILAIIFAVMSVFHVVNGQVQSSTSVSVVQNETNIYKPRSSDTNIAAYLFAYGASLALIGAALSGGAFKKYNE